MKQNCGKRYSTLVESTTNRISEHCGIESKMIEDIIYAAVTTVI